MIKKFRRTNFGDLKVGDKFKFIHSKRSNHLQTIISMVDGYVGEFACPFTMLDTQSTDRPYIPLKRVKLFVDGVQWNHAFTNDYIVMKYN